MGGEFLLWSLLDVERFCKKTEWIDQVWTLFEVAIEFPRCCDGDCVFQSQFSHLVLRLLGLLDEVQSFKEKTLLCHCIILHNSKRHVEKSILIGVLIVLFLQYLLVAENLRLGRG